MAKSADQIAMLRRQDAADDTRVPLEGLAETLWKERHVVELLLFKLITAKLILAADERRFVAQALGEVERVVDVLREAELRRSLALEAVASAYRKPADDITLEWLATNAPRPWRDVFVDHEQAFGALAQEIEETSSTNRQLATAGLNHIQRTIETLTGPHAEGATYDRSGRATAAAVGPVRLDEAL